jgi:hypothetical protein
VPDSRRRKNKPPSPNSLVASAQVISSPNGNVVKSSITHHKDWQRDAWEYYDTIGELRFGVSWISNAMSRVNLVAARPPLAAGDEPMPIDLNDPEITPAERRAAEIVSMIADGASGQGQMLGSFGIHLSVVGISYLIVEPSVDNPFSDQFERWEVLSSEQLRDRDGHIEIQYNEREWRRLHPNAVVVKVWRKHPRRSWEADAPTHGVLSVLNEIDLLSKHIRASAQSRLAGAGLLAIPAEAVFPSGQGPQSPQMVDPDDQDITPPEDNFVDSLIDAMTVPLTDRGSAAAVVPLVIKVPGELVDKIKHISFSTPFDSHARELLDNAIRRLALGMDIPPEILTGTSAMNHWGAWQVAEEAITLHIEPLMETVAHALTVGFLEAALISEGYEMNSAVVWYDTSDLRTRPDKSASAIEAYDRIELSGIAMLRELGLSVEDAPDEEEKRERVLMSVINSSPALAPSLLAELGYIDEEQATELDDVMAEANQDNREGSDMEPIGSPDQDRTIPERANVVHTALAAACDIIVRRALERAGSRLRSAAGKGQPGGAASIQCDDPYAFHTQIDATMYSNFDALLEGAWTLVPEVAERYRTDPEELVNILDTYTRALLAARQAHRYGRLALALGNS